MKRFVVFFFWLIACFAARHDESPLMGPARAGDTAELRRLAANGADPNERGGVNDWTPLMHAIHTDQIRSVEALLDGGADVNRVAGDGFTALMMAAGYGYTDIVQLLLRRGGNPRIAGADGIRPIDLAVAGVPDIDRFTLFQCQEDTIRALRAADPSISVSPRALMWARAKRCRV